MLFEEFLEFSFDGIVRRKLDKIIQVEAEREWDSQRAVWWVRSVNNVSTKEARVVCILAEANLL